MNAAAGRSSPAIAACLIVRDESDNLGDCLRSLQEQVDEVVVVDTGSSDGTPEAAARLGARVGRFTWSDDFSAARNAAVALASADYILSIDADERAPKDLRDHLDRFMRDHPGDLGRVRIRSRFFDPEGRERFASSHATRFFPRDRSVRFRGVVHEQVTDDAKDRGRSDTGATLSHEGYALDGPRMREKSERNRLLLEKALAGDPNNPYLRFQLGKACSTLGLDREARVQLERSLENAPRNAYYRPELWLEYLRRLKQDRLETELWTGFRDALLEYPDLADLHFAMGDALRQFQIPDLALIQRCYETCLLIGECGNRYPSVEGTGSYLALYNLGALREAMGDDLEALRFYSGAASLGMDCLAAVRRVQARLQGSTEPGKASAPDTHVRHETRVRKGG